jgi:hypothetical protein
MNPEASPGLEGPLAICEPQDPPDETPGLRISGGSVFCTKQGQFAAQFA